MGICGSGWVDKLGNPVVVTANDPGNPVKKVAELALVICGAWSRFSVKDCEVEPRDPASSIKITLYWPPVDGGTEPVMLAGFPALKVSPCGSVPIRLTFPPVVEI
jgi:hypothetical protein